MTTRRDLLKLASALGLAGTVPTLAERIAAAQHLGGTVSQRVMLDPATFANEIHQSMGNTGDTQFDNDWYGVIAPEPYANYVQVHHRLERVMVDHGMDPLRECGDYQAAAVALFLAMYDAGLRHGAAYENLRRSLVGELVQCTACWGAGITRDDGKTCSTCGGSGNVAMRKG